MVSYRGTFATGTVRHQKSTSPPDPPGYDYSPISETADGIFDGEIISGDGLKNTNEIRGQIVIIRVN